MCSTPTPNWSKIDRGGFCQKPTYVCMHSWKKNLLQQKQQALSFLCVIACCWTHITEFYIGNDSSPMFTTKNTDVLIVYDGSIGPTKNSSVTIGLRTRLKLRSFQKKFGLHRLPNFFQIHRFASLRSQKITIRLCLVCLCRSDGIVRPLIHPLDHKSVLFMSVCLRVKFKTRVLTNK